MLANRWLPLLVLSAGVGLAATASVAAPRDRQEGDGTLRMMVWEDVRTMDPATAVGQFAWTLEYATCAKLFDYPDAAGEPGTQVIPEVVRSFDVSTDARTYTFELRRTFRFHTGAPVTARSFADAFNRDANPQLNSPATQYMHEIVGADDVVQGKAQTISGIRVLGAYRLQIRLTRPVGDLTARLTMPYFCPIPPGMAAAPAGVDNPAGSGPYYIAERIPNRRTVLERNRYYGGRRKASFDDVIWTVEPDVNKRVRATEQGDNDYLQIPGPPDTVRSLVARYGLNRPGGRLSRVPALATWFFAFNHERPAFAGPGQIPLEKAINYALDRPALVRPYGLNGRRTDRLLPPGLTTSKPIYPIAGADLATARKWLARAKYKPDRLVLYSPSSPGEVAAAQVFTFNLRQLGIEVEVRYPTSLRVPAHGAPFDVAFNVWAAPYADPAGYFLPLLHGRGLERNDHANFSYLNDPKLNARIDAANRLTGGARHRAWGDLEADLLRDAPPVAPYVTLARVQLIAASLGCFLTHPVYGFDIVAACRK